MDYTDRLRRLAINDERLAETDVGDVAGVEGRLDSKSLALARIAALVSVGGAEPSFGAQVDAAISSGTTATQIVDVLLGVIPIVGLPLVVAAAPKVALALGHDLDIDDVLGEADTR
ncbi:carboxymuconolactone decarboxylase family protein [Agromyces laixinhei]|uniref:carboxymuconolactone decarboxylase family protein n=1 Tax=Agromyces laixinhei TaxID=2585717 RepID=UPI001115C857|nr:carboxymuconolactone decarboxylase family protein [Agromyces laixinhei]